jgi:hypothetical protein
MQQQLRENISKLRTLYNRYEVTEVGLKRIFTGPGGDPYKTRWEDSFETIDYENDKIWAGIRVINRLLIEERANGNLQRCKSFSEIKHSIERRLMVPIQIGYFILALLSFDEKFIKFDNAIKNDEDYRLLFQFQ